MPSFARRYSTRLDLATDTTGLVLATLRDAARLAAVPYLQDAAGLALGIVVVIQVIEFDAIVSLRCLNVLYRSCRALKTTKMLSDVLQRMRVTSSTLPFIIRKDSGNQLKFRKILVLICVN